MGFEGPAFGGTSHLFVRQQRSARHLPMSKYILNRQITLPSDVRCVFRMGYVSFYLLFRCYLIPVDVRVIMPILITY